MAPFLRNFFHRHHYYCDESGGNDEKQKWTQTAADDQQRISAFNWRGYVSAMIFGKKVVYEGEGESGLCHASIEKSDKTSIGPNYFLNLYWDGAKEDAKRTIVKTITLYIDGKKYDDRGEYDLSEYTGEEMDDGGHMEDHIATFDFMPEEDVIGHALSVKVEWKTGDEENAEIIKLTKIPWYK
ncbi:hypothetical protein RSC3_02010 [Bacillus paralicheniformis]|nr:hypothetical protein RSC3_02010 [Bacillus paralicheniformis]